MTRKHKRLKYKYDEVRSFKEGRAAVKRSWRSGGHLWGFIDDNGDEIIDSQYIDVLDFHEGLAAVNGNGGWGYIDEDGNEVIPHIFDGDMNHKGSNFCDGIAKVSWYMDGILGYKDGIYVGQCSYINKKGELITSSRFKRGADFHEGLAAVQSLDSRGWSYSADIGYDTGLWGYLNENGELAIPFTFNNALDFHEGLAAVQYGDKDKYISHHYGTWLWGVINQKGEFVVPYKYKAIRDFHDGLAAVQSIDNNLWGYINTNGEEVVPCRYRKVQDFHEGIAAVQNNDIGYYNRDFEPRHKWKLIDTSGHSITCFYYSFVEGFRDGYSIASTPLFLNRSNICFGYHDGFIDKTGNFKRGGDYFEGFRDGLAIVGSSRSGKISYTVYNTDFEPVATNIDFDFPCYYMYLTEGILMYHGEDGYYHIYNCNAKTNDDEKGKTLVKK